MKYWPTAFVTALIWVAVLLPGSNIPDVGISGIDKLAHFTLFFLWSLAVRYDFTKNFKWLIVWIVGLLFSISTEVLQIFVEDRSYDVWDMVADTLGLSVGLFIGTAALRLLLSLIDKIF
jgi:VanZ family protein